MSIKQRIEKLEELMASPNECLTCGGLHTKNWVDMIRTAMSGAAVCGCRPCCQWIADLNAQALADSQPLRRQHFTDPKGH